MTPWMYAAAIIACGVGAAARYALSLARGPHKLPWPTFTANIVGTGVLTAAAAAVNEGAPDWVLLILGAGLAGGLTTFSTLALDAVTLWGTGRRFAAVGYLAATAVVGIGTGALGWALGSLLA